MTNSPMFDAALEIVRAIKEYGHEARFVGGCVRDKWLGLEPKDIDIASTMTPDILIRCLSGNKHSNAFDVIDVGGKAHGTLVVRHLIYGQSCEVTTLRKDVITDGRHAKVLFDGATWEDDAARRDFTINAMSYDPVTDRFYDYFGGETSILNQTIEFVGDPIQRVREDYLRILRLFRFMAKTGFSIGKFIDTVDALQKYKHELVTNVSKERILSELLKIVDSPYAVHAISEMNRHQISDELFGEEISIEVVQSLRSINAPDYVVLMGALSCQKLTNYPLTKKARRFDNIRSVLEQQMASAPAFDDQLTYLLKHASFGVVEQQEAIWVLRSISGDQEYLTTSQKLIEEIGQFPLSGRDILKIDAGVSGKEFSEILDFARTLWVVDMNNNHWTVDSANQMLQYAVNNQ